MYKMYLFSVYSDDEDASTVSTRIEKSLSGSDEVGRRVHGRHLFLTYTQCTIDGKDDFERAFKERLRDINMEDASYYGCREHHKETGIHYHVLVRFAKQPNWSFETARCWLEVGDNGVSIVIPRPKQNIANL